MVLRRRVPHKDMRAITKNLKNDSEFIIHVAN